MYNLLFKFYANPSQLVAIMFTDIEGYTAIRQRDEQKPLALKDRHREILHKEHYQFNGRIIQYPRKRKTWIATLIFSIAKQRL